MKKLLLIIILFSSCTLNRVTMREYFSHIRKSGKYKVKEKIGNLAVINHFADTVKITGVDTVKAGDFINVVVLK